MTLDHYMQSSGLTQEALAHKAGVSPSYINQLVRRKRRGSPEVAKRIEQATGGAVSAASLLGVAGDADAAGDALQLGPGRWLVRPGANGDAVLPARMLEELGLKLGDPLAFRRREPGVLVTSASDDLARAQAYVARHARPGGSVVEELIAERRSEAACE